MDDEIIVCIGDCITCDWIMVCDVEGGCYEDE